MNGRELYEWLRANPNLCPDCKKLVAPSTRADYNEQSRLYHAKCWDRIVEVMR